MSDWEEFKKLDNFKLAWHRILRSTHYENKDRLGLKVFEANLEANLASLIDQLETQLYEPQICENVYIPKHAGTVRRISILTIRDRLVYQAITNVIAVKTKDAFEAITNGHVFAHLMNKIDSPFMLRRWQGSTGQYQYFQSRFKYLWNQGNYWLLEADIASFYDSIDHEFLCTQLKDRWNIEDELVSLLAQCLRAWSPQEEGHHFSRGLPQGDESSDYLATLFLLPADEEMLRTGQFSYIRYVDDIRILAPTKDKVRQALIKLDLTLKKQALILQPSKTGSRYVADINDELDKLAGKLSMIDYKRGQGQNIDQEAEDLFLKSWHTLNTDKDAETHLIFALNRISINSRPVRDIAIQMLSEMPWRSNFVTGYLSQFNKDNNVITAFIKEITTHKVYAWHVSNCIRALSGITTLDKFQKISQTIAANLNLRWFQRLAAVESLQHDEQSYSFHLRSFSNETNYLVRCAFLVAAAYSATTDAQRAMVIRTGIRDQHPQVIATAVWLFLEYPTCGVQDSEFGPELGVHRLMLPKYSTVPVQGSCYIEAMFSKLFKVDIPNGMDFHIVFSLDYDQAVIHLRRAIRYHDTDPVMFITALDNFNHIMAIIFNEKIEGKNIPRDQYENILLSLKANHGILAVHLLDCHELRSRSSALYPRATSLGTWSQDINHKEKNKIINDLQVAYQYFVDKITNHMGIAETGEPEPPTTLELRSTAVTQAQNELRQILDQTFDECTLTILCFDHFIPIYSHFQASTPKRQRIGQLIDYCLQENQIEKLRQILQNSG